MDEIYGPAAIAIYVGELDTLTEILTSDPGLATRVSSCGHPTLLQLVACDADKIVDPVGAADVLVAHGASMAGPLAAAAGCGSQAVVERLLEHGAPVDGDDPNWLPLDEALYWNQDDIASLLLAQGASIRALSTAAALGDMQAITGFFDEQGTPLASAGPIGSPFTDTIPADLAHDAASIVNHAFVMAVNAGRAQAAEFLLQAGAEVNAIPPGFHWKGTALHAAAWRGHAELVTWLLDHGADRTIRDGLASSDAVGWAAHHGHEHLIPLLEGTE